MTEEKKRWTRDHVTETPDHPSPSTGENENLSGKETDHLGNLPHVIDQDLKIMIASHHGLSHLLLIGGGGLHLHLGEWKTVLMVVVEMMISTCETDTGMNLLPGSHTHGMGLITEVIHTTEIGGIHMILQGAHTQTEGMIGLIGMTPMEGMAVRAEITLDLEIIQVQQRGQEWIMMVLMIFTVAAKLLRLQLTVL